MGLGNAKPPATCFEVQYLFHGQPARAIFLTRDKAEDYVSKYHLDTARIYRCWSEEIPCIAELMGVATESTAGNGTTESDSAVYAVRIVPNESDTQ